jgi:hypothetical protein
MKLETVVFITEEAEEVFSKAGGTHVYSEISNSC